MHRPPRGENLLEKERIRAKERLSSFLFFCRRRVKFDVKDRVGLFSAKEGGMVRGRERLPG
jgi:hypothetical protein